MSPREKEPWRSRGFTLVSDLLAQAGLPEHTLSTAGLLFEKRLHRRAYSWTDLAHTAKRHLFPWPGQWPMRVVVKHGHEQAFLGLLERIRTGKEVVVQYPPHVAAMHVLNASKRTEKAARHAELVRDGQAFAALHEPVPSEADKQQAAIFLERWQQVHAVRVLYAKGNKSLLGTGLSAGARSRIIHKLKPAYFVERTDEGDDPYSGSWTFQRALAHQRIAVRMVLCHPVDGPPRCEQFVRVFPCSR